MRPSILDRRSPGSGQNWSGWVVIAIALAAAVPQWIFLTIAVSPFLWFYPTNLYGLIPLLCCYWLLRPVSMIGRLVTLGVPISVVAIYPLLGVRIVDAFAYGIPILTVSYAISLMTWSSARHYLRWLLGGTLVAIIYTEMAFGYILALYARFQENLDVAVAAQVMHPSLLVIGVEIACFVPASAVFILDVRQRCRHEGRTIQPLQLTRSR